MPLDELRFRSFTVRYLTLFGGETISKLCVMAAFAYLARALTASDYGLVELALSVSVLLVLGVESGMGLYGARVVAAAPARAASLVPEVMVLRLALGVPAYLGVVTVAAHYRWAGVGILAVSGLAVLLTPLLTQWVFQGFRQMQWVAGGAVMRNLTFVALVLALVRPGSDLRLVALAELAGVTVLAIFNTVVLRRRLHLRLEWRGVVDGTRRLFGQVWFMGIGDFAWACQWYAPSIITGWIVLQDTAQVAWIAVSVRVVLALHTFVWLYFFNMLPNLAKELAVSLDDWRELVARSMRTSLWPACLIAVGGTLGAPLVMPLVFGPEYSAAVVPFQIVIWMIPVAWFSGHFRFSLIAAGQQRWEFAVSAATAVVTVAGALVLAKAHGSVGAAIALLTGGIVNAALAYAAMTAQVGTVRLGSSVRPVLATTVLGLVAGFTVAAAAGTIGSVIVASLIFGAIAARQDNDLVRLVRGWLGRSEGAHKRDRAK